MSWQQIYFLKINKTLKKYVTQRCQDGVESQRTKDSQIKLQQQVSLADDCAVEMWKDHVTDQEKEDPNVNVDEDIYSV